MAVAREFTLDEIASGLQMLANSMRSPSLDGGLINTGVMLSTRHGRAAPIYRSGLIPFLQERFPEQKEPLDALIPLLMYDTLHIRMKKNDHWLRTWFEQQYQCISKQSLHFYRGAIHIWIVAVYE